MIPQRSLYILAVVEGMGAMAVEVLGGKMLSPYFGSSFYIWTSVIGITLLNLALGYFWGGRLSSKKAPASLLPLLFSLAAVIFIGLPLLSNILYELLKPLNLFLNCTIFSFLILGPPLFCLGATTPIIIQLHTTDIKSSGNSAGRIFALSTLGGIITTFCLGFFLIPSFGVRWPMFIMSLVLLITANLLMVRNVKVLIPSLTFFILFSFLMFKSNINDRINPSQQVVYTSEGIMGQLKVVDFVGKGGFINRALMTNNSPQSLITKTNATALSQFNYVHFISSIASLKPAGSKTLIFGMAGGSLVYELQQQDFNIDVVDIDERMFYISQRYFYFQKGNSNLITDDARHFIKTSNKRYDIIVIDISSAEVQPSYLYTLESFNEIKKMLNPGGILFVNFQGVLKGASQLAIATWSLYHTLVNSGYHTYYYSFHPEKKEDVQFVASITPINFNKLNQETVNICCTQNKFVAEILIRKGIDSIYKSEVVPYILTDDIPRLDKLKFEAVTETRLQLLRQFQGNKN